MHKRGQVTTFVIIGIILIVVIATLLIVFKSPLGIRGINSSDELTQALQTCLAEQVDISLAHPYFASFPTMELSRQWLENQTRTVFIEKCAPIAKDYKGASVSEGGTTSTVTIQGKDLNHFETIRVTIHFPVSIQQGDTTQSLPDITAEVYEKQ